MAGRKRTTSEEHHHKAVTTHLLRQREGVPYEVEQKFCPECSRVLDEKPVRRAAA